MRILHVITGLGCGGAEGVLWRLISEDTKNQHEVVSLTSEGHYGPKLKTIGIGLVHLGLRRNFSVVLAILRLRQIVSFRKPDVVQTWMYHADFIGSAAALLAGRSAIVWNVRHSDLSREDPLLNRILVRMLGAVSRLVPRQIIVCSEQAANVHRRLGYKESKLVVIPNGYERGSFRNASALRENNREAFGLERNDVVLSVVARWARQKGHKEFFQALAQIGPLAPNVRIWLVGPMMTTDNKELVSIIRKSNLQKHVTLFGSRADIPEILSASDVLVLPSTDGEGFPNVLAEAMLAGTPSICTDVGESARIVGSSGWVVPPRDIDHLASSLQSFLELANSRESLTMARERCITQSDALLSVEQMRCAYWQVWDALCQDRKQRR